ncbi:MAG: amino acid permease [Candidatus Aminicenantes bacterium]|nr:amino acid permease [Candidatus Aminicenantes bacterium]
MSTEKEIIKLSNSGLAKKINLFDATLFIMGSVLGSGIFMTTGHVLGYVGREKLALLIWLIGGLFTLFGGLVLAELGIKYPKAGGPYIYLKETYGKWAGFLFGWIFFWIIECGGIAALSVGFADHLTSLLGLDNLQLIRVKFFPPYQINIFISQIIAIIPIIFLSFINNYGIKMGILIQNISMIIRAGLILVLTGYGYAILGQKGQISLNNLDSVPKQIGFENYFLAMLATLWTYDGWYAANCTAEEMKSPEKDLPKAIILGILGITLIYLGLNLLYVLALPASDIAGKDRIGETVAKIIFGPRFSPLITIGIALTIFGCLSSTIIYGPRVYFAMARDKIFFENLGKLNIKTKVPSQAIWVQAILSSFLCLFGQFQSLYEYVVFSLILFFGALGLAIFFNKNKNRAKNIIGEKIIKFIAGIFVLSCLLIYISCFIWKTKEVLLGLLITLSGYPAYKYWEKKNSDENIIKL